MIIQIIKRFVFIVLLSGLSSVAFADATWIDVRSVEEYTEQNIEGHLNIPHGQIAEEISKHVSNKDGEIKLYCRSGNRAGKAKKVLEELGYTNVSNEGGISDVKEQIKSAGKTASEVK